MKSQFVYSSLLIVLCGAVFIEAHGVEPEAEAPVVKPIVAEEPEVPDSAPAPIPQPTATPDPEPDETPAEETTPPSGPVPEAGADVDTEATPAGPRRLDFPAVPNVLLEDPLPHSPPPSPPGQMGDLTGPAYVGHRAVIEKYAGWGWIRKERDSWRKGKWVALKEELGKIEAPGRYTRHPESDQDVQYRLFGEFTDETVYEPNIDIFIPIFALKGFERIGPAPRPNLEPPRGQAPTRSRPTTGGARTNPFRR